MNGAAPINFNNFTPPKLESMWSLNSLGFYGLNLFFGIYGHVDKFQKERRVDELRLNQEDLLNQIHQFNQERELLEKKLGALLEPYRKMSATDRVANKGAFDMLSKDNQKLSVRDISANHQLKATFGDVVFSIMTYVGTLILHVASIGLYGMWQNNDLKNRIAILENQNQQIKDVFDKQKKEFCSKTNNTIALVEDFTANAHELEDMQATDVGQAYLAMQQALLEAADLQAKEADLQKQLTAAKAQYVALEKGKDELEDEVDDLKQENQALSEKEKKLKQAKEQADKELDSKKAALDDLNAKFQAAKGKADKVEELEQQLKKLSDGKQLTEVQKLQGKLGPIAPLYQPSKEDKTDIDGAVDIDKYDGKDPDDFDDEDKKDLKPKWFEPDWLDYLKGYAKRYKDDKRTAGEIIEASFHFVFESLIAQSGDTKKLKLNKSFETKDTSGRMSIFRMMAFDIVRGAKLQNTCTGLELTINGTVNLLPSKPEMVLQYEPDGSGGFDPVVAVRHQQRDDFTPPESGLPKEGVDPFAIKWILEKLTKEEEAHLVNLCLSSLMEDSQPDYANTIAFMSQKYDPIKKPRIDLIQKAFVLLTNMAGAYDRKFTGSVFAKCWNEHLDNEDFTLKPFKKADDETFLKQIEDVKPVEIGSKSDKVVDWVFDVHVFKDERLPGAVYPPTYQKQPEFESLITQAKLRYESVFKHLKDIIVVLNEKGVAVAPSEKGKKFPKLEMAEVIKHFYVSHEMLGTDITKSFYGGQRCLLSNLLAVFVSKKDELTDDNAYKLRKAMAAYLDKLQKAKADWNKMKHSTSGPHLDELKELAILADGFETAIQKTHHCSVHEYQLWLRNETWSQINGVMYYRKMVLDTKLNKQKDAIDIENLGALEIQLCAFAMGVKIGVIGIDSTFNTIHSPAKVDDIGRVLPEGQFYGPNTKELLLLGIVGNSTETNTYHGLFPRFERAKLTEYIDSNDYANLGALEAYWKAVKVFF